MIKIAARFLIKGKETYLPLIQNPSSDQIKKYIDQFSKGKGHLGVYSDNEDIEKLDISVENGYFYFQLIDNRSEWGFREFVDPSVDLANNIVYEIDSFNCTKATITNDVGIVLRIVNEFVNTNDVSIELMPM